jgi:hypothetical protein
MEVSEDTIRLQVNLTKEEINMPKNEYGEWVNEFGEIVDMQERLRNDANHPPSFQPPLVETPQEKGVGMLAQKPPAEPKMWNPQTIYDPETGGQKWMPENPITISGVGNRMMIQDPSIPSRPAIDEYGNPVAPEIIKKIQSNLGEAPISEEDRAIFGMKPPSETDLDISSKLDEYGKFLDQQGIKDPKERAKYMITARNELLKQDAIQQKATIDGAGSFKEMASEDQEKHFQNKILTGKDPKFSNWDTAGSKAYIEGYAKYLNDKGYTAPEVAKIQSQYKSLDKSLQNMTKQEAPMSAFVDNINAQVNKVSGLIEKANRSGYRFYDMPRRELEVRAMGSGEEAVIASYLMEISREIGKLSTGSSASIAELSVDAQKKWDKIHDPSLSFKELMPILNATKDQGNMRMSTWTNTRKGIESQINGLLDRDKTSKPNVEQPQQSTVKSVAPQAGEVRGGFRFKGGNYNDKNNWEKI